MSTLNPDRIKSNHRKRIRVWIIAFLTGSVLMVWLVAELDLILQNAGDRLPVMSYTTALINIITQPQFLQWQRLLLIRQDHPFLRLHWVRLNYLPTPMLRR